MLGARSLCCIAVLLAAGCGSGRGASDGPACPDGAVATQSGRLVGFEDEGACAYLGVPYAEPPTGDLRWRAPVSLVQGTSTLKADRLGAPCMQVDFAGTVSGDENCLTLNLWRPPVSHQSLPVLVFFHGGGNVMGSAVDPRYHGARLAEALDALVVTVQFRLGALGYLVHPALSAESEWGVSGNYGLRDQVEALGWVRRNARAFGADPDRVTLMGQSAGARNVCAILASPNLTHLYRSAILHSGACNAREYADSERYGSVLSQALGCELDPDPARCMRLASAAEVTTAFPSIPDPMTISAYNPTVDGVLLTAQPLVALAEGRGAERPVIVGSNADETKEVTPVIEGVQEYRKALRAQFGEDLVEPIVAAYPLSDYDTATEALVAVVSDTRYACAARQSSSAVYAGGGMPYRFWFSHRPERPPYSSFGATHGLELMYLFGTYEAYGYQPSSAERRMAGEWQRAYGQFLHDGAPKKLGERSWLPDGESPRFILGIGAPRSDDGVVGRDAYCDFWDELVLD